MCARACQFARWIFSRTVGLVLRSFDNASEVVGWVDVGVEEQFVAVVEGGSAAPELATHVLQFMLIGAFLVVYACGSESIHVSGLGIAQFFVLFFLSFCNPCVLMRKRLSVASQLASSFAQKCTVAFTSPLCGFSSRSPPLRH